MSNSSDRVLGTPLNTSEIDPGEPQQAAAEPTSTRRTFLAQAAGSAVLAATAAPALSGASDPIFAAIAVHKAAVRATRTIVDRYSGLEHELPIEKRRSRVTAWEDTIVDADDPRWIETEQAVFAAHVAETEAACALVNVMPSTMAGVMVLLKYAVSADPDGETWPDDLFEDETQKRSRSWHQFMIANLVEILPGMVQA